MAQESKRARTRRSNMMFGTRRVFVGVAEWDSGELLVGLAHLREAVTARLFGYHREFAESERVTPISLHVIRSVVTFIT